MPIHTTTIGSYQMEFFAHGESYCITKSTAGTSGNSNNAAFFRLTANPTTLNSGRYFGYFRVNILTVKCSICRFITEQVQMF